MMLQMTSESEPWGHFPRLDNKHDEDCSNDEKKSDSGSPVFHNPPRSDMTKIRTGRGDEGRGNKAIQAHRNGDMKFHSLGSTASPARPVPSASGNSLDNASSNVNGLHHRHHHQNHNGIGNQSPRSSKQRQLQHMSPWRRKHGKTRKQKWTVEKLIRVLLCTGILFYIVMVLRVIRHSDSLGDDSETLRGRLSDLINSNGQKLDNGQSYLRSPFLGKDFITKKSWLEDPAALQRRLEKRVSDRQRRTRPPQIVKAESIAPYQILSMAEHEREPMHKDAFASDGTSPALADASQLCGMNAQEASKLNPQSFLQQDVLNSQSRVLITGILSNPIAFHLALALNAYCGVEVMVGIDPMLPNTISNRLRLVEQMKILSTNAPKMIQPILVPLLGLDPRVKKSKRESTGSEHPMMLHTTGELNLLNFKPTHIVHLSTAAPEKYPAEKPPPKTAYIPKRPLSPYQTTEDDHYEPKMFSVRSSMTAMEQILASIVSDPERGDRQPHLTYASAARNLYESYSRDLKVHSSTKVLDEILADTYHSLFGVNSVGIRFPQNAVFGPWGQPGCDIHQIMEAALQGNHSFPAHKDTAPQELLYVQDAVEAILTTMQFRPKRSTTFDLKGHSPVTLPEVASTAQTLLSARNTGESSSLIEKQQQISVQQDPHTTQKLAWFPRTSLREGILRSLAWHIDRVHPFGLPAKDQGSHQVPATASTGGDALLLRNSVPTCAADDLACHAGYRYLPCASECSIKAQCKASIFDPVKELAKNMTEGCDAVLYTQSLRLDIDDLKLQSQFEDDAEPAVCNLAFVAERSQLVRAVIEKIPSDELVRLGVPHTSAFDDKLQRLNGRLLYRGWILIWVDPGGSLSTADSSLLKLSPGRMFSRDVLYAVFVEENFSVSPTTDDVRFLIGQMDRGSSKERSIYRWAKADDKSKPKKVKFKIPAAPEKRASILLSQLKYKISQKSRIPQDTRISIMDAVRFMRFEVGSDPTKEKESEAIKLQKEFYRRIPSFVNSKDLRDNLAPIYKYEFKHWVRTRWVVHDLKLEEARQLRCDWYQEHVQWGSEIDQLSFAAVMAHREVQRRLAHWEPDDRVKAKQPGTPAEVRDVTDFDEWYAMDTEQNKRQSMEIEQSAEVEKVPDHIVRDAIDEDGTEEEAADALPAHPADKKLETGLYVRIISDRIMSLSRKAWARYRAEVSGIA